METKSPFTTLCYIEQDGKYLMMHRVKKKQDENKDKWIGIGGHFEWGESPEECLLREVAEETGLQLLDYAFRGLVTFVCGKDLVEYMALFTSDRFEGICKPADACDEGELVWIEKEKVYDLNLWEGDKIFFRLLEQKVPFFSLKLVYDETGKLLEAQLNGKQLPERYRN